MKSTLVFVGIIICLIAFGYWANSERVKEKKEKQEKISILETKEHLFQNKEGEWASSVKVWSLKYSELEKANSKNKALRSDYEQRLSDAYKEIENYKRKNKDLISYYSSLLEAKDTIYQVLPNDCILKPIKTKHINIDFIYQDTLVGVSYDYHTNISTLVTLYPKRKANGKKHFPNWGWLYGWDKNSITTVEDKKATLSNQISIEFKR